MRFRTVLLLFAAACSNASSSADTTPAESDFTEEGVSIPLAEDAIRVPLIRQRRDYTCGDVSALAILRYWKPGDFKSVGEKDLIAPLATSSCDGTEPKAIAKYISSQAGLSAEVKVGATAADLDAALARGEPTIVDLEAWQDQSSIADFRRWEDDYDDGHYVVLVGKGTASLPPAESRAPGARPDPNAHRVMQDVYFFMDPSTTGTYAYIPRDELVARWHDTMNDDSGQTLHADHVAIFVHNVGHLAGSPITPRTKTTTPIN